MRNAGTPLVSLVMAEYNSMKYLAEAMDSSLAQSYKNIELIVIDDHSTDGSFEYARSRAAKDDRISVYLNQSKGAGSGRNMGLSLAKGEFVMFLDGDDVFSANMVNYLVSAATKHNSDLAVCNFMIVGPAEGACSLGLKRLKLISALYNYGYQSPFMKSVNYSAWNKLYRREFIEKQELQFQNCRHANDVYFVASAFLKARKLATVSQPLLDYYLRSSGTQGRKSAHPLSIMTPVSALWRDSFNYEKSWQKEEAARLALSIFQFDYDSYDDEGVRQLLREEMRDLLDQLPAPNAVKAIREYSSLMSRLQLI